MTEEQTNNWELELELEFGKKNSHVAKIFDICDIHEIENKYSHSRFPIPKYVQLAKMMIEEGFDVKLYIPPSSIITKYLFFIKDGAIVKVRYSNHLPSRANQIYGQDDTDIYVGVSRRGAITTLEAKNLINSKINKIKKQYVKRQKRITHR